MSNPFSTAVARALQPSNESLIKILALITSAVTPDGKLRVSLPGLNKSSTGLGNVDNTSDVNKPVSTAQADAIALKQDTLPTGAALQVLRRNATNTALEFTNTTNVAGPIIDTPPESPSILNDEFDNLSTLPGGSSPKWTQEPGPLGGSNSNAVRDIVGGTWLRHRNMVAPLITAPSQWKFNHVATLPGESWVVRGRFMIQLGPNFVDSSNYIHLAVLSGDGDKWGIGGRFYSDVTGTRWAAGNLTNSWDAGLLGTDISFAAGTVGSIYTSAGLATPIYIEISRNGTSYEVRMGGSEGILRTVFSGLLDPRATTHPSRIQISGKSTILPSSLLDQTQLLVDWVRVNP